MQKERKGAGKRKDLVMAEKSRCAWLGETAFDRQPVAVWAACLADAMDTVGKAARGDD